jgi:hypothetical protein
LRESRSTVHHGGPAVEVDPLRSSFIRFS